MKRILPVFLFLALLPSITSAESTCAVYFTGVGCPHCARTDPYMLDQLLDNHPNFVVIEYEVFNSQQNAQIILQYDSAYKSGYSIPLVIFDDSYITGDRPILENIEKRIVKPGKCALAAGASVSFEDMDLTTLPGKPKIWRGERILIGSGNGDNDALHELLTGGIKAELNKTEFSKTIPMPVALSGREAEFEHAVKLGNWLFQWNGEDVEGGGSGNGNGNDNGSSAGSELTVAKIVALATVDAINPCAIAVLVLMLISVMAYDPSKKRNVLFTGLAFVAAVFVMYFVYGLIIIKFFQAIQALSSVRLVIYQTLGVIAIILGILNIKDFFWYKPGGITTEMPIGMRPRVRKILSGVTSPKGAFALGAFVTLFLLPCTMGPYIIAGGILSAIGLLGTAPWLLLYNFIFVLPMIGIILMVYAGFARVEDVSGWEDRNIKKLHMIAGIIMLLLGIVMTMGMV